MHGMWVDVSDVCHQLKKIGQRCELLLFFLVCFDAPGGVNALYADTKDCAMHGYDAIC